MYVYHNMYTNAFIIIIHSKNLKTLYLPTEKRIVLQKQKTKIYKIEK